MGVQLSAYLYGIASFRVTAPLVIERDSEGRSHHRYSGYIMRADPGDAQIEDLLKQGLIEEVQS